MGDSLCAQELYAIREKFREGLYDAERKPRLAFARNYFLEFSVDKDLDFQELESFYREWRDFAEYVTWQRQEHDLRILGAVKKETIAFKCSKRGNDVYVWRLRKRLSFLNELEGIFFDPHGNVKKSNVLFVTLTYDVKISTIRGAWETIGDDFNKWIRNLRKKFGRISHLRCWDASKKGFPHIHVLMVFHDYQFRVTRIKGKFRVVEKEAFEKSYHSFVDVQAVRKIREGIKYITKYLTKINHENQTQTLTLALLWLFRKRSFAVSKDFQESIHLLMKNAGRIKFVQIDLQGMEIRLKVEWVFIGVFSARRLGIDQNEWRKVITDREVLRDILS